MIYKCGEGGEGGAGLLNKGVVNSAFCKKTNTAHILMMVLL